MLTTIIKSALLGLTLGAALAYAAEPDPIRGAGDYPQDRGSPADQNARSRRVGSAVPRAPAASGTVVLPPLPLASLRSDEV